MRTQISYLVVDKKKKKIEHVDLKTRHANLANMKICRMKLDTCGLWLSLRILNVSFNRIDSIPEIMSLEELYCGNCAIKTLPAFLPKLKILHCPHNKIQVIENYPRLMTLDCSHNLIRGIQHEQVPELLQLSINSNPIVEITCRYLVFLSATHCPIMIIHKIKSLTRRMGDRFITKELMDGRCPLFIDWRIGKCKNEKMFKCIFPNISSANLVYKYLFQL